MLRWRTTADHFHTVIIGGPILFSQSMICVIHSDLNSRKTDRVFSPLPRPLWMRLFFAYCVFIFDLQDGGFDPNRDPNAEKAGGCRRTQWMPHRSKSTQKRRKALQHNAFRRSSYLHTQEVTGSSPAVSTKKFLISQEIRNFFVCVLENCACWDDHRLTLIAAAAQES